MTTFKELTEADVLALSASLDEPDWLRDRRQEAFKAFSDLEWPTNRFEEWRYTNPKRFNFERALLTDGAATAPRTQGVVATLGDDVAARLSIVDGAVTQVDVGTAAAQQGLVVASLSAVAREHEAVLREHLGSVVGTDDKFDALNLAAFTAGAVIYVPPNVEIADPIVVTVHAGSDGAMAHRVLVVLGHQAKAVVYVDHNGGAAATVSEVIEVSVGEGANAQLVTAQDWGASVDMVACHRGATAANANFRHLEVTLGGRTVYIRPDLILNGTGSSGELLGVYFGSEGQQFEHRSLIHHNGSHTGSKSVYKGALQGDSRATWFGNIRISPHAKATTSDETNRNLILSDRARADTIPFLEIETADVVSCGHHSSVGQVDEAQLFYLESRGIPRDEAARMLVFAFFAEVTDQLGLPAVTDTVLGEIDREIRNAPIVLMNQRRS